MTDPMELVERLETFEGSDALGDGDFSLLTEAAACIREMVELVGRFIQAEDDAKSNPIGGVSLGALMDCRDNTGCVYQSAHLAGLIATARCTMETGTRAPC